MHVIGEHLFFDLTWNTILTFIYCELFGNELFFVGSSFIEFAILISEISHFNTRLFTLYMLLQL